MRKLKPGDDLSGPPYTAKDLEGFTEQSPGAYIEDRDPRQMLHDMKTAARQQEQQDQQMLDSFSPLTMAGGSPYTPSGIPGPLPTRGKKPGEPGSAEFDDSIPRIGAPGTGFDDPITSASMKLASGIYEGAGGYEYEVMPGGEIKILKAPKDRGVGVTLKLGHPAHEAIFDELSEGGAKPKAKPSEPADKPDEDRNLVGAVKPDDGTKAGEEMARQQAAMAKQ